MFSPPAAARSSLLLLLAPGLAGGCAPAGSAERAAPTEARQDDAYSVVVAGHIYSLFVPSKGETPGPPIGWTEPLEAFVEEVLRIDPDHVFLLGDNTRYGIEEEYDFLEDALAPLGDRVHLVAGNHEYRNPEAFLDRGGLQNHAFVHRGTKYVVLDAKTILEEEDLEFLRTELADHENYDHVFLLTHLGLAGLDYPDEPLSEIDPYEAYTRRSNWNYDVVPLLVGKVDAVFVGDYNRIHLQNVRQELGTGELLYIHTSFLFGRGREPRSGGDGPMLFLELRFQGSEVEILPHAVPLDVRHPWYRQFPRPGRLPPIEGLFWTRHAVPATPVSLLLPFDWEVESENDTLLARSTEEADWKVTELSARALGRISDDAAGISEEWRRSVVEDGLALERETRSNAVEGGAPACITLLARGRTSEGRALMRWSSLFDVDGLAVAVTISIPASLRRQMSDLAEQILARVSAGEPAPSR